MNIEQAVIRGKELRNQGLTNVNVAKKLTEEGYRTVKGHPINEASLHYYMRKSTNKQREFSFDKVRPDFMEVVKSIRMIGLSDEAKKKVLGAILDDLIDN